MLPLFGKSLPFISRLYPPHKYWFFTQLENASKLQNFIYLEGMFPGSDISFLMLCFGSGLSVVHISCFDDKEFSFGIVGVL